MRRSGWKIEVLGVDERGRWLASSPSGTFPRFPRSRLSLPGPSLIQCNHQQCLDPSLGQQKVNLMETKWRAQSPPLPLFPFIIADYNVPFIFVTPKTNVNSSFFFLYKTSVSLFHSKIVVSSCKSYLTDYDRKKRKETGTINCM